MLRDRIKLVHEMEGRADNLVAIKGILSSVLHAAAMIDIHMTFFLDCSDASVASGSVQPPHRRLRSLGPAWRSVSRSVEVGHFTHSRRGHARCGICSDVTSKLRVIRTFSFFFFNWKLLFQTDSIATEPSISGRRFLATFECRTTALRSSAVL